MRRPLLFVRDVSLICSVLGWSSLQTFDVLARLFENLKRLLRLAGGQPATSQLTEQRAAKRAELRAQRHALDFVGRLVDLRVDPVEVDAFFFP